MFVFVRLNFSRSRQFSSRPNLDRAALGFIRVPDSGTRLEVVAHRVHLPIGRLHRNVAWSLHSLIDSGPKNQTGIFIDRILGQYVSVLVSEEECRAGEDSQKANDGRFEWYKAIKSGGSYLFT